MGVPDAHWLSLNPKLEGLIVPSKFYGIAAAGKPIIAIADKDGELARLVRQFACGFVVEPADADSLVNALLQLSAQPELVAAMGRHARQMLDAQFTKRKGLDRWRHLLEQIDHSTASGQRARQVVDADLGADEISHGDGSLQKPKSLECGLTE